MCSFIGGELNQEFKDNLEEYAKLLKHRGHLEGCGYIYIEETMFSHGKSMSLFETIKEIKALKGNGLIILHQRKSSVGGKTLVNTHPVFSETGDTSVMHNGTNRTFYDVMIPATSDSQAIATMLEVIPREHYDLFFDDLGVMFHTDKENITYLYKDKLRPLVVSKDKPIFASEPLFDGEWAPVGDVGHLQIETVEDIPVGEYVDIALPLRPISSYCSTCKKTHLKVVGETRCGVCVIYKELPPKVVTKTLPSPTTVFELRVGETYSGTAACLSDNSKKDKTLPKDIIGFTPFNAKTFSVSDLAKPYPTFMYPVTADKKTHFVLVGVNVAKLFYLSKWRLHNVCGTCSKEPIVTSKSKWNKCRLCKQLKMVHDITDGTCEC